MMFLCDAIVVLLVVVGAVLHRCELWVMNCTIASMFVYFFGWFLCIFNNDTRQS